MPTPPVLFAWLAVVAIWSTTPLFLHFSTLAFPASLAGGLRMALAALVLVLALGLLGRPLPRSRAALLAWAVTLPGVFGAMYCSYLAAQRIPSGLISVVFGLSPVLSALFARAWLDEPPLGLRRALAALLSLGGLVLVAGIDATHAPDTAGLVLVCVAVLCFSGSAVAIKRHGAGLDPVTQTAGALVLSLPFYALAWAAEGAPRPQAAAGDFLLAAGAILYLALIGSVLGFILYYRLLQQMPAASAALITVVTPVFALALGALANEERFTPVMLGGAALVLAGVALFLYSPRPLWQRLRRPAD